MKRLEPLLRSTAQRREVQAQIWGSRTFKTTQSFTKKNRGPPPVASLQMQLRYGHLQDPLQAAPFRISCFMPELLKQIMSGVPLTRIEKLHTLLKARVRLRHQRLDLAGFLPGSLRRRIDSGVTSSISSGPMYSSARSSVI